jgi:hypothetical protein
VIFLFKWVSSQSQGSEPSDGKYDRDASEHIFFAQQTIQNACGTQALLSVLLNVDEVDIGNNLREFKDFTIGLTPDVSLEIETWQLLMLCSFVAIVSPTQSSFAKRTTLLHVRHHSPTKLSDRPLTTTISIISLHTPPLMASFTS